ncbi:cation:proton antiporter [Candidatus Roizmanbacteria bacterium]|nr:cation:proton antiporter [Candidatus Roizmanbacteria bacterium]
MNIFLELTEIVFIAIIISLIMRFLKQPLIVGYLLSGILAGPFFFNALHTKEFIEILSKIGVTILLFIVGLNMSPRVIKEIGKVALITGIGQVIITTTIGYFAAIALGLGHVPALYISIGLTFSSTIIVLKLLSDKGDLNKLYGRVAIGFLLVQDILAALILVFVSSFSGNSQISLPMSLLIILLKSIQVAIILYLVTTYLLPKFMRFVAVSQELLFLFSIAWGLVLASLFYMYGFSAEIGALVAGICLSVTPYAYEIGSRLKPLRDFFIVLFFILIGSQMQIGVIPHIILPAIALSLFVLLIKPIIMHFIMHVARFKSKTAYLTAVTTSQISEFSLILAAVGFSVGKLSQNELSLITLVGLITITGSAYIIQYADKIYPHVEGLIKKFEFIKSNTETNMAEHFYEVILFGFDRVGYDFINLFKKLNKECLVVDFNPHLIRALERENIPFKYGDVEDVEFLQDLSLDTIKMGISTIPDFKTSLLLLQSIRKVNKSAIVILLSHDLDDAKELYKHGASYVIMPHYLSARHASEIINKLGFDKKDFAEEKEKHLAYIEKRGI